MMNIALIGNPNTGKTSLFNGLTGSYEYIGNWSGVTVEKKVGLLKNIRGQLIDLPGIYSFTPVSKEEGVVTRYCLDEQYDKVINIVDASQLGRNLPLTIQLLEGEKPVIVCLNMMDVASRRGIHLDIRKLSEMLGCPVIPIIARTGEGIEALEAEIQKNKPSTSKSMDFHYGAEIEPFIEKGAEMLASSKISSPRWAIIQLFEGNPAVYTKIVGLIGEQELQGLMDDAAASICSTGGKTLDEWIYQKRQDFIDQVLDHSIIQEKRQERTMSEKIDRIVMNKYLGMPLFFLLMFFMFKLTFEWLGTPLSDLLDAFFSGPVTRGAEYLLSSIGASTFITDLIIDGIIAGVGGVLVFVPQILILFFFISLLEDSGYMSRVAVVMDKIMEGAGMNGKSFIPMIISFGCNVPGIMAARTIEMPKERLMTVLLAPFMSCSARLPVYSIFVAIFFTKHQSLVVMGLYILGIMMALLTAKLLSMTLLKEEHSIFVIDLPAYHLPKASLLWRSTWDKGKGFIQKAGTFIFAGAVLIWLLSYAGPAGVNVEMDESFMSIIGGLFAPILSPIGFGTWQAGAALLTGFLAKESILSTMNIIYATNSETSLQVMLLEHFTALSAFSFIAFILLYIPCLATVAAIYKETGSKKWTGYSICYSLVLAYLVSFLIYQSGRLLGFA